MAESAVTMRLEDWSQLLAQFKEKVGAEAANEYVNYAEIALTPIKNPNRITLRWDDEDLAYPDVGSDMAIPFVQLLRNFEHDKMTIPDEAGGEDVFDDRVDINEANMGWQSPMIVIDSKEMYMAELERALPGVIDLALKAGAKEKDIAQILKDAMNYRRDKDETAQAYIEKARGVA